MCKALHLRCDRTLFLRKTGRCVASLDAARPVFVDMGVYNNKDKNKDKDVSLDQFLSATGTGWGHVKDHNEFFGFPPMTADPEKAIV